MQPLRISGQELHLGYPIISGIRIANFNSLLLFSRKHYIFYEPKAQVTAKAE